eukprot:m.732924 g.732924  ORF g.732924 m.732924 type:complete len:398 (+) comp23068_c0_seq33:70-1263(+)
MVLQCDMSLLFGALALTAIPDSVVVAQSILATPTPVSALPDVITGSAISPDVGTELDHSARFCSEPLGYCDSEEYEPLCSFDGRILFWNRCYAFCYNGLNPGTLFQFCEDAPIVDRELFPPWGNDTTTTSSTAVPETQSDAAEATMLDWNVSTPAMVTGDSDSTGTGDLLSSTAPAVGDSDANATGEDASVAKTPSTETSTTLQPLVIDVDPVDSGVVVVDTDGSSGVFTYVIIGVLSFAVVVLFIAFRKVRNQTSNTVADADGVTKAAVPFPNGPAHITSTNTWVTPSAAGTVVARPGLLPPVRYPAGRNMHTGMVADNASRSDGIAERLVPGHARGASERVSGSTGQTGGMPHRVVRPPEAVYTVVRDTQNVRVGRAPLPGAAAGTAFFGPDSIA